MSSTPIVLLHGALGALSQVSPLQSLLGEQHDTIAVEFEGHGDTPSSEALLTIERFATNVRDALDAHDIRCAHFFGYSMGGYVALHLAAEVPDLVASVVTLGTKLEWTPEVALRETSRLDPAVIRTKVPKFADALQKRHAGAGGWELVLARTASLMTRLGHQRIVDAATLGRIGQPVRLMVGDRDSVVTIDETVAASRTMVRGECCVLPNTLHPFESVRLPVVSRLIDDFLKTARS